MGKVTEIITNAVGVASAEGRQELLEIILGIPKDERPVIVLVREPDNDFDSNAIAVLTDTGDGIGYIRSHIASSLSRIIDAGSVATVVDYAIVGGGSSFFGITLTIQHN